jgi:hypothetical protein
VVIIYSPDVFLFSGRTVEPRTCCWIQFDVLPAQRIAARAVDILTP